MLTTFTRRLRGAPILLGLLVLLAPATGSAQEEGMPLTYEQFEIAVPHVDLETCPADFVAADVFCRATLNLDSIHVFAFADEGEQPLVGFATFDGGALAQALN